jgi:uncharacterized protein YqgV (UPF0045/DUF77 family)
MREIQKEPLISCQLSFYPLAQTDPLPEIGRALSVIQDSGLEHSTGRMSTVVRGPSGGVFALLRNIAETMDARGCKFSMTVTLSNFCGCE